MDHKYLVTEDSQKSGNGSIDFRFLEAAYDSFGARRYRELFGFVPSFFLGKKGTVVSTSEKISKDEKDDLSEKGYDIKLLPR